MWFADKKTKVQVHQQAPRVFTVRATGAHRITKPNYRDTWYLVREKRLQTTHSDVVIAACLSPYFPPNSYQLSKAYLHFAKLARKHKTRRKKKKNRGKKS